MRTIGVVTVGRSDYGLYVPILHRIAGDARLRLQLWVAGAHLDPAHGDTIREIEQDGFEITERLQTLQPGDRPEDIGASIGAGVDAFSRAFARRRPDVLLILGDRFDMAAAALAALPHAIPVAHVHGGELTAGAIDDALRHAMTKLSHLHFAATDESARRIIQLGEEPWRVTISGAPGLDRLRGITPLPAEALARQIGMPVDGPLLLVTYHPVTLAHADTADQIGEVLAAVEASGLPAVLTYPNADTAHRAVIQALEAFAAHQPRARVVRHLGSRAYASLMGRAAAMVGNSSSGLIEAPSFRLPAVNVGLRQAGRLRARNVIDVACRRDAVLAGIRQATAPGFLASLQDLANPYGDGLAAPRIVDRLADVPLDERLLLKQFYDAPVHAEAVAARA